MTAVHGEPSPANDGTTGRGWTVDDSQFGARLALVRQRMGWNVKEAAKECGVPGASWASWENGAMPRKYTEVCEAIAERTGADYLWLMAGSSRPANRGPRPQASAHYFHVPERTRDHPTRPTSRPRDTRPKGQLAAAGPARSGYLPRGDRKNRDR